MWRRWNERDGLGRFEWWTRASVYVLLAAVPVLAVVLGVQHPVRVPGLAVFLLLSVAQAGVCIALLHAGLGRYLAAGPPPNRWLVASAAALTAAGVLAGAAAFPAFTLPSGTAVPVSMLVTMLFGGALILALTPLLSLRALTALVVVSAAAASGLTASAGRPGTGAYGLLFIGASLNYAFIVGVGVLTCRGSAWTLRIMSELDRSRTAHARLSVAEERLHLLDSPGAPRAVTLSMDNDRVHTPAAGSGGSGLAGLGERLAGLGGSITTGHPRNGHFRLEARLPACGAAAAPPGPGQRGTGVSAETPAP